MWWIIDCLPLCCYFLYIWKLYLTSSFPIRELTTPVPSVFPCRLCFLFFQPLIILVFLLWAPSNWLISFLKCDVQHWTQYSSWGPTNVRYGRRIILHVSQTAFQSTCSRLQNKWINKQHKATVRYYRLRFSLLFLTSLSVWALTCSCLSRVTVFFFLELYPTCMLKSKFFLTF